MIHLHACVDSKNSEYEYIVDIAIHTCNELVTTKWSNITE